MSSIWCPKCQFNKRKVEKCPKCGFVEKDKSKKYYVTQGRKAKLIKGEKQNIIKFEIHKNSGLMIILIIIAISLGYLAYSKYRENKMIDDSLKLIYGTDNIDEINKKNIKMWKNIDKNFNESIEKTTNMLMEENKKILKRVKDL